jgi:hypothetical protein
VTGLQLSYNEGNNARTFTLGSSSGPSSFTAFDKDNVFAGVFGESTSEGFGTLGVLKYDFCKQPESTDNGTTDEGETDNSNSGSNTEGETTNNGEETTTGESSLIIIDESKPSEVEPEGGDNTMLIVVIIVVVVVVVIIIIVVVVCMKKKKGKVVSVPPSLADKHGAATSADEGMEDRRHNPSNKITPAPKKGSIDDLVADV